MRRPLVLAALALVALSAAGQSAPDRYPIPVRDTSLADGRRGLAYGLVDRDGRRVGTALFAALGPFVDGLAPARVGER